MMRFPRFMQAKPSFFILGAQKSGTTSLYKYLGQHPEILLPKRKEVDFFSVKENYVRGKSFYHTFFEKYINPFSRKITFDASPNYLYYHYVPARIHNYSKDLKFIIILRNPVQRAYSAWNMYHFYNQQTYSAYMDKEENIIYENEIKPIFHNNGSFPSFDKAVDLELSWLNSGKEYIEPSFVKKGIYHEQIHRYFQLFDKEQFLIINYKDLKIDLERVIKRICIFLNIEPFLDLKDKNGINKGKYSNDSIKKNTTMKLKEFYKSHNESLFEITGEDWGWNN